MSRHPTIVLATANPDKVVEIKAILGDLELLSRPPGVPDVIEDGGTLEENARLKAVALVEATAMAAVADDTGLFVDALDGDPGVDSAYYAGEGASYDDNVTKLLAVMAGVPMEMRTAHFRTVALLRYPDGREMVAQGRIDGHIAESRRGSEGMGYDPVFVPHELGGRTFAEVGVAEKSKISHRARAFSELRRMLG